MAFDRDKFFSLPDRPLEKVETPEWADAGLPAVWIRTMSGTERDSFEAGLFQTGAKGEQAKLDNYRAQLLVRSMTDEQGNRLFSDGEAAMLGGKSAAVLDRLIEVAKRLSGVSKKDEEETIKNS